MTDDLEIIKRLDEQIDRRKNSDSSVSADRSSKKSPSPSFKPKKKRKNRTSKSFSSNTNTPKITLDELRSVINRLSGMDNLMQPVFESILGMMRKDIYEDHHNYLQEVVRGVLKMYFPDSPLGGRNEIIMKEDTKKRVPFLHERRKNKLLEGKVGDTIETLLKQGQGKSTEV